MSMRKWASLLAALVLCAAALCGCHGSQEVSDFVIPASFDESREYEITFWAKNDTNKTQMEIYKKAIADFESLYPNIKVNMRPYTDYSRIYEDVITNIPTRTTPNVCITYPDHIATYLTGTGTVVPLDGLFADEKYGLGGTELKFDSPRAEEISPKFLEECAFAGHHYALPFMRSTEACYVNKTFVEKLGYELPEVLTWDFVWEVSEKAMEKDGEGNYLVNGQKVMIPFIYKSTDNMMIQMLRQLDAGYSTDQGEVLLFNDTTRSILKEVSLHARSGAFSTFKISSYPANFLCAGQCIFAIDSTAGATWMGTDAPLSDISKDSLVRFETEVMAVPQFDTDNMRMISQGPSVCVFNKDDPQEVMASWLFAQYLLTDGVQIAYAQTEGYAPVTLKAQGTEEYKDYLARRGENNTTYYSVKIDATRLLLDHTDDTFVTPVFNGSASLRDAAGTLIENVVKATRKKTEVDDEYLTTLFSKTFTQKHLDQVGASTQGKAELGPLPKGSVALLTALVCVWAMLGIGALVGWRRSKKKGK